MQVVTPDGGNRTRGAKARRRETTVRAMDADDLQAAIALDAAQVGRLREDFLERRWRAASQAPGSHIALVAHQGGELAGYLLGQVLHGAFGVIRPRAALDTIIVGERWRRNKVGRALLDRFRAQLAGLRIRIIGTLAPWNNRDLLGFLDATGFRPSRDQHLVWDLEQYRFTPRETDAVVRPVRSRDLLPIVSIDMEDVPASRKLYFSTRQKAHEDAPAWHPFLVAELEGRVAGFVVGAVCRGEFGIDTPRGIVDSLGVGVAWRQLGVGSALLGELSAQMRAMDIRRIETTVRWNNWSLLQFFDYAGFRPSSWLNLEWRGD